MASRHVTGKKECSCDTALNLLWLALGVFALASTLRSRRHRAGFAHVPVWLHVCGVALIIAALFPYISATDDVLRIQHMDVQANQEPPARIRQEGSE